MSSRIVQSEQTNELHEATAFSLREHFRREKEDEEARDTFGICIIDACSEQASQTTTIDHLLTPYLRTRLILAIYPFEPRSSLLTSALAQQLSRL